MKKTIQILLKKLILKKTIQLFVTLFFLLSSTTLVIAQNDSCSNAVAGRILDLDTKEPIPYVTVKIRGTEKFTMTNIAGEFLIKNLCNESNTLIISCIGYCNTTCKNHHQHGKSPHIYLTQKVSQLQTVTIQAEQNKKKGTETISQVILKKEEINIDPTQSLASSITNQQGITLTSNGANVQLPVIHGLYGNRIIILNNDLKHGFQNWGTDHAPEIDISTAHRITIIKGAAGVRYGPEALGGAISIKNNPLYLNESFESNVSSGFQTNGKGYFVNTEISQGLKKWSYHVGANYTQIGDRYTPDYSLTNSGKKEKSVYGGLRYHLNKWDFKMYYSYLDQNLALLRTSIANSGNAFVRAINSDEPVFIRLFSYDINEPNQIAQHHLGKLELNWWYSDDAKLTLKIGRQLNKRDEFDVRRNAELPIIDLDLITDDYQLEWKHPGWLMLDGVIGLQIFKQHNDNNPGTGVTPFIPNYKTLRYSSFIIESLEKNKNTYEAGFRLDYELNSIAGRQTNQTIFSDQFSLFNLTSSIGYVRKISENSSFRTNFGTAWRTPNMFELYSFGQHGFKTTFGLLRYYNNNEENIRTDKVLELESSNIQAEKGFKFINEFQTNNDRNTHTVTFYSHYIQNYIFERPLGVFGTIRGPMPAFIFTQADAFFIGADYSWEKDWTKLLKGKFGVSYLWSKNISENEPLINQPPISINYNLALKKQKLWKFDSSKLTINPSYTFSQFMAPQTITPENLIDGSVIISSDSEIFDFKDVPNGYFLLDVSWSLKWKNLTGSISVNNLLNTRYRNYLNEMRYFVNEPGRNILFTMNYKFKNEEK
jgi:iron complex outermembrane receptor protein